MELALKRTGECICAFQAFSSGHKIEAVNANSFEKCKSANENQALYSCSCDDCCEKLQWERQIRAKGGFSIACAYGKIFPI